MLMKFKSILTYCDMMHFYINVIAAWHLTVVLTALSLVYAIMTHRSHSFSLFKLLQSGYHFAFSGLKHVILTMSGFVTVWQHLTIKYSSRWSRRFFFSRLTKWKQIAYISIRSSWIPKNTSLDSGNLCSSACSTKSWDSVIDCLTKISHLWAGDKQGAMAEYQDIERL